MDRRIDGVGRVRFSLLSVLLLLTVLVTPDVSAAVRHVNAASTAPVPDGQSWATAYPAIQPAVDAAASGDEVWVAAGTYTGTGDQVVSLKAGVTLYGGFSGAETARDQRDWKANGTILDGQHARRCVTAADTAVVDGFTQTNGRAEIGGGMYGYGATAIHCTFTANTATAPYDGGGGGMIGGTAIKCVFRGNTAYAAAKTQVGKSGVYVPCQGGGGMYDGTAVNCVFTGNLTNGFGGGMCSGGAVNCTFAGNEAIVGGGMYNGYSHEGRAVNCVIWGNTPSEVSGTNVTYCCLPNGMGWGNIAADPLLVNPWVGDCRLRAASPCIDAGQSAEAPADDILGRPRPQGARIDMGAYEYYPGDDSQPPADRPVLRVNAASTAASPDGLSWDTAFPTIQAASDQGGPNTELWVAQGLYTGSTLAAVASLHAATFLYGGFAGTETMREQRSMNPADTIIDGAGGRRCILSSETSVVDGITLRNGYANNDYGGGMLGGVASRCVFKGNWAQHGGGGMSNGRAINCVFTGNASEGGGGGMRSSNAVYCTITGNTVMGTLEPGGGGLYNGSAVNSILWGNFWGSAPDDFGGSGNVVGSCIPNNFGTGSGNIQSDPLLTDAVAGDVRLRPGSPCIDAGQSAYGTSTDLLGVPRPQGAGWDMGAYESVVKVTVPDLTGLARTAARELTAAARLYVRNESEEYHATIPNDHVIRHTPAAGLQVAERTPVDLVLSKGPQPVTVPDVVGQAQGAASSLVTEAGLALGTVTEEYSAAVPVGAVISQQPAAGTAVLPGTPVDLVLSKGPQPVTVPDVAGQAQGAASLLVTEAGLAVGTVTQQYSAAVPVGVVISQLPEAGTPVLPGTPVNLVVSRGVQPSVMPEVAGQARAQAEAAVTAAGLTLGLVTEAHSGTVAAGAVISQSPAAGTELPPGTAVSLVVSLGPAPVAEGEGEPVDADTARQALAQAFDASDSNGDGTLSFGEAGTAVPGLTQSVFDALDADGDGQLSPEELGMEDGSGCAAGCRGGKAALGSNRLSELLLLGLSLLGLAVMGPMRRP